MLIQNAVNIKDRKMDSLFFRFQELISKERVERIGRFHFEADKIRSLYAEVLLRYALSQIGISQREILFEQNEYGKPILVNHDSVHFNVSHSGDWVICAVSSEPVGVDVEQVKNRELDIAERFFTHQEYEQLLLCPKSEQSKLFCQFWTLKESYVKALGMGLSKPFSSFWFRMGEDDVTMYTEDNKNTDFYFYVYEMESGYQASICTKEKKLGKYEFISVEEMENVLL